MKRLLAAVLALVPMLLVARPAAAQTAPEATLFIGYSYLRTDVGADDGGTHGVHGEYTYFFDRRMGFTLSASGYWGTLDAPPNAFVVDQFDLRQLTLLGGPAFMVWRGTSSELDVSLFGGAARRTIDAAGFDGHVSRDWGAAAGANLSLDFRVGDRVWIRALEPGVLFTNFGSEWQTDLRVAVGLVLRAGRSVR